MMIALRSERCFAYFPRRINCRWIWWTHYYTNHITHSDGTTERTRVLPAIEFLREVRNAQKRPQ